MLFVYKWLTGYIGLLLKQQWVKCVVPRGGVGWSVHKLYRFIYCKAPIIRMLEIFALFASSKKMRKLQAHEKWEESYVYQSIWLLTQKLQARKLPGWTIPRKFKAANYRRFTVVDVCKVNDMATDSFMTCLCGGSIFIGLRINVLYEGQDMGSVSLSLLHFCHNIKHPLS